MFDDPKMQKPAARFVGPSASTPNVEDIFAKASSAPAVSSAPAISSADKPVQPAAMPAPQSGTLMAKAPLPAPVASKKGIFIAIAIIVVVAILGAVSWFVYDMISTGKSINTGIEKLNTAPQSGAPATVEAPASSASVPVVEPPQSGAPAVQQEEPAVVDSDADGLTDTEEVTYGTNPNTADTDADGLTDKEEVKIYQTDPLNPDTDGDSYLDGGEVKNGYNPNGPGKLLDFEKAKKALQGVE
jgi:hypothetical protein